ncbi:SH3 domain-containing protein [Bacillus sp. sid0103]|uniref:SH3 domain-containing protein n=1 Tax=Bacillus sp. sid0103 TaxID=2856337 RepID=UPI001C449802|nr:SH3 domain-containing protein [Bacillus sp. sid0103]MBV7504117.1 SH3 domain-containing protein [Bacillus sp. sid0103]
MKILLKVLIALALVVSILMPFQTTSFAASTSSATVNTKALNVREKPTTHSMKKGVLKKGTKVTVYLKTKSGWSQIKYQSKKAYVSTKYLKFISKKASYLLDKTKIYTYKGTDGTFQLIPTGKKYDSWDIWHYSTPTETQKFIVGENSKGLYTGYIDSEYYIDIKYPAKVGQKWDIGYEGEGQARITSLTKTVKTKAGTFKNCIEVKEDSGIITYYAKHIGKVKTVRNGKTVTELISLKKK